MQGLHAALVYIVRLLRFIDLWEWPGGDGFTISGKGTRDRYSASRRMLPRIPFITGSGLVIIWNRGMSYQGGHISRRPGRKISMPRSFDIRSRAIWIVRKNPTLIEEEGGTFSADAFLFMTRALF